MANDLLAKLSDEQLERIANGKPLDVKELPDEVLEKIAGSPVSTRIFEDMKDADKVSRGEALKIGVQRGASFGFRPAVAGAGAGLGAFVGNLEQSRSGEGLAERLKRSFGAIPQAYEQGRRETVAEEAKAMQDRPGYTMAGDLAGSVLTAPLAAAKGLKGVLQLGAVQGTGRAVSEAENIQEAGEKFVEGIAYGAAGYGVLKGAEKGAKLAAPVLKKGFQKAGDLISNGGKTILAKIGSALTGESEKNIATFISKNKEINKIIGESGGEISVAADQMRNELSKQIQSFRQKMGAQIGQALDSASPERNVPLDAILGGLKRIKDRINIKLNPEDAGQIDEIMQRVSSLSDDGLISLKQLHEVQEFLSDRAKGAYLKAGQIFVPGKNAQLAAKSGAREAKILMDKLAPEVKEANSKLFQLHKIEENINKNLIAPGKPEAALLAAGGATTGRNRQYLQSLGGILGKDVVGEAEKLSATAAFSSPSLLPKSAGGTTSTSRTLVSAGIGTVLGGPGGGAVMAALSSPMALKQAINLGVFSKATLEKIVGKPIELSEKGLEYAIKALNSPQGLSVLARNINLQAAEGPFARRIRVLHNQRQEE